MFHKKKNVFTSSVGGFNVVADKCIYIYIFFFLKHTKNATLTTKTLVSGNLSEKENKNQTSKEKVNFLPLQDVQPMLAGFFCCFFNHK